MKALCRIAGHKVFLEGRTKSGDPRLLCLLKADPINGAVRIDRPILPPS